MRTQWWLMSVTILIHFATSSAWAFHASPTGKEETICSSPEVLLCDNFEDRDTGGGDWAKHTYKNAGWSWSETTCHTVSTVSPYSGSKSLREDYLAVAAQTLSGNACRGNDSGGAGFGESYFTAATRTIYVRWYVKRSANWVYSPIAEKGGRLSPMGSPDNYHMNGAVLSGGWPIIGTTGVGAPDKAQNINLPVTYYGLDTWKCIETRITLNDPGSESNGYIQGWVDGVQKWEYPNVRINSTNGGTLNHVEISAYWNCLGNTGGTTGCHSDATGRNVHPNMQRWIDNVVVSRQRIGCLGAPQPIPPAPSSLIVK